MAATPTPPDAGALAASRTEGRTEAQLAAIYQELILDHYRRPRNKGPLEAPDAAAERRNPLCGDEIVLQLAFDGDVVREARFTGRGCSISQASASMLTQAVRGRTRAEVDALLRRFTALVHGQGEGPGAGAGAADGDAARDETLGELRALQGVARFPARIRCATLAWSALDEALRGA